MIRKAALKGADALAASPIQRDTVLGLVFRCTVIMLARTIARVVLRMLFKGRPANQKKYMFK